MKLRYDELKKLLPSLDWPITELADKLSQIGHETEVVGEDELDISLTANRKDCRDSAYLAFDLAGIYGLKTDHDLVKFTANRRVEVTLEQLNRLLGSAISAEKYQELSRLGFVVEKDHLLAPDFRVDVNEAADIAEELIRLVGYQELNLRPLSHETAPFSKEFLRESEVKTSLARLGFSETRTDSFTATGSVELKNPFSAEQPFLRPSLEVGLLTTLAKNPFLKRALFFEVGDVFGEKEQAVVGLLCAGYKDTVELEEKLCHSLGCRLSLQPSSKEAIEAAGHPKQAQIHFAQVELDAIMITDSTVAQNRLAKFKAISKFPPLIRDVTIVTQPVNEARDIDQISREVTAAFPELLFIEPIDRYQKDEQSVSLTFRLIFQKFDSSFTQNEIEQISQRVDEHFASRQQQV